MAGRDSPLFLCILSPCVRTAPSSSLPGIMCPISLIPYVCGAGASVPGCEYGPLYARDHGLAGRLQDADIDAAWAVDPQAHWAGPYGQVAHSALPPRGSAGRFEIVAWHCQSLSRNVAAELRSGNRVVTIGGDHSMAAGSIAGMAEAFGPGARIGVIWIDAHADLNTFTSSLSKAIHGMPVAALLGIDKSLAPLGPEQAVITPENVVYAGLRDIDPAERDIAAAHGIRMMSMDDLRTQGIARTLQDSVMQLASRCDHLVLSIDLDAFSLDHAPSVGTPVPGGFTPEEIVPVLAGIVRTHAIEMVEIVEFNPQLPGAEKTFDFLAQMLCDLLPARIAQKR